MHKHLLGYGLALVLCGAGIAAILAVGAGLESGVVPVNPENTATDATHHLQQNLQSAISLLLLQIIVIGLSAKGVGWLFARLGQPTVMGEMLTGILLGPSLLGWVWPAGAQFLFPAASLDALKLLSQVGVILYMFVVGSELDLPALRHQAHAAVLISHVSILLPFLLGAAFSLLIYRAVAPAHVAFGVFALFMGTAMSITAFPVLVRILTERGLAQTPLGRTAIACAAVDDVTAWCILAGVVALANAEGMGGAVLTLALTAVFIGGMLLVVKPMLARWWASETQPRNRLGGVLLFGLAAAWLAEVIGIHALFGAFLAGVVLPAQASLRQLLKQHLEPLSTALLLPLFFAFTGLRTQVGLLADGANWLICLGLIAVAIVGKLGGSFLAARWTGLPVPEALTIGALMNTRGLMELLVLNIGYELGILSPQVFTMMVLMALVTTFMTGPLLTLLEFWQRRSALPTLR